MIDNWNEDWEEEGPEEEINIKFEDFIWSDPYVNFIWGKSGISEIGKSIMDSYTTISGVSGESGNSNSISKFVDYPDILGDIKNITPTPNGFRKKKGEKSIIDYNNIKNSLKYKNNILKKIK